MPIYTCDRRRGNFSAPTVMPHIISHSSSDCNHPVYKNKRNSGKNKQTEEHKEQKVPMTYDTVKNAATGSGNDVVKLKKK